MNILLIGLGGFFGAISRYLFSILINPINNFPLATLIVNIFGCFFIGLLFGLNIGLKDNFYYFFGIGFIGSFTTMSAFTLQSIQLTESNGFIASISYVLLTFLLTIIATIAGINIGR